MIDDAHVSKLLDRSRLAEVIERPAQRGGVDFTPGLVHFMVDDTAGGDAIPLLAYTLSELYKGVGSEHRITIEAYEAVGGVVGALRNRADALTRDLQHRGRGTLVLPTLVKLATVDGEGEPTARRIHRGDLDPD